MKTKKRTAKAMLSLLLCVAMLLACAACAKVDKDPTPPTEKDDGAGGVASEVSQINGVELSKFSIVYSDEDHDYSKRAAQYIQEQVLARTGQELALIEDDSSAEYEIVVGETSREISADLNADTQKTQFAILAQDKCVALEGDYFIIAAAAYFFIETYVPTNHFSAEIPKEVRIHEPIVEKAENYILLIGDGMGLYQTLLLDVLENNASFSDGEDIFYGYYLPYFGMARTYSLSGTTDSAAAGTALATGTKTKNSYVGQDENHNSVQSLTELAALLRMSTAVMSTDAATGATPAAFSAHVDDRGNSNEILECQAQLKAECGTLIDCGFHSFEDAQIALIEEKVTAFCNQLGENGDGFFLMYEEAHIDKYCHNNEMENSLLALLRFNQVIALFMEYAFYHPNTLVVITADHETGKLLPTSAGGYAYHSTSHSSHYVPVFAYGDGAELFDDIIMENVQIPQTLAALMGVKSFGDQSTYQPLS